MHKIKEYIHRYEAWRETGKLVDGSKKMVALRTAVDQLGGIVEYEEAIDATTNDEEFVAFCKAQGLVVVEPPAAHALIDALLACKDERKLSLCFVPDVSASPGEAHLSFASGTKELLEVRAAREKEVWEREARDRDGWRMEEGAHEKGCGHCWARREWDEE